MAKLKSLITPIFLISLVLGFFIRSYQYKERFMYAHDNDLASWMVKDIVFDHHIRLVGQLTSSPGIFIGPLFYYMLIPFYWLSHWDPIGSVWYSLVIGIAGIASTYFVFTKLHGRPAGSFASFLYAVSWGLAGTEREVVPTTPVFLWTVWFYYAINLLFQGKKQGLLISFVLMAFVWHLNLALGLLFPLVIIAVLIHRKNYRFKDFVFPFISAFILSLPLFAFEIRHNFNQARSLLNTFSQMGSGEHGHIVDKISHVFLYAARNATWLFYWDPPKFISVYFLPCILIFVLLYLVFIKKTLPKYNLFLFPTWAFLIITFFVLHPINLSEYYLNGINILWIALTALLLSDLFASGIFAKYFACVLLCLFSYHNILTLLEYPVNQSGYIQRKALVEYIAADSRAHGYPCVSVSYITSPGNNFGYRYFFFMENLHVNQPKSLSPVYSIVYPQSFVDRLDKSFGVIGLILPDYSRYTPEGVAKSCSGQNANLTDPMFGFTN